MSEGKLLLSGLAVILIFGVLMSVMLSPFVDIEEETEGSWIEKIGAVQVTGYTIDIFKYIISTPVWIFDSVGDVFGSDNPLIKISGTGEHDTETITGNISLDGDYKYKTDYNPDGVDEVYENVIWTTVISWDTAEIRVNKTDSEVDKAWLILDSQGTDYEDRIYEPENIDSDIWYENWVLVDDSYDWNDKADGIGERFSASTPTSATEGLRNFFDNVKEQVQNSVKIFGLIPDWIGIPLFILLVVAIVIALIKLLPIT